MFCPLSLLFVLTTTTARAIAHPQDHVAHPRDVSSSSASPIPVDSFQPSDLYPASVLPATDSSIAASSTPTYWSLEPLSSITPNVSSIPSIAGSSSLALATTYRYGIDLFPVVESTASALAGFTDQPTTTASPIETNAWTQAARPQAETSQASLIVPTSAGPVGSGIERTLGGDEANAQGGATTVVEGGPAPTGSHSIYTELLVTTLAGGQQAFVTTAIEASIPQDTSAAVLEVAGTPYSLDTSLNVVIAGQTASAGGAAITVSNTMISLFAGGFSALVGTSTVLLAAVTPVPDAAAALTLGSEIVTTNSDGGYIVSPGLTLSVGGPFVTIENMAYALQTNSAGQTFLVMGPGATFGSSTLLANYAVATSTKSGTSETALSGIITATPTSLPGVNAAATGGPAPTTSGETMITAKSWIFVALMCAVICGL